MKSTDLQPQQACNRLEVVLDAVVDLPNRGVLDGQHALLLTHFTDVARHDKCSYRASFFQQWHDPKRDVILSTGEIPIQQPPSSKSLTRGTLPESQRVH